MCLARHWSNIQRIQSAPSTKTSACFVVSYPTHSGLLGTQTIPCFHPPLLLLLLLLFSYSICWMLDGRITFPSHRDFATVSLQGSHFFPSVGICSGIRKYVSSPDGPLLPASCPPSSIVSSFVLGSAQTLLSAICPYSPCACLGHREKEKEQLFCAVSRGYISQVGNLIRSKSWIPTLSDCLSVSAASNMAPGFHCVTHHLLLQHRAPASDPPTWTTFVTKCTIRRWRNVRAFPRRKKRTELLHVVWRATSLCVKKKKKKPGEGEEDFSRCWGSGRSSRAAHDAGKMLFCIWRVVTGQSRREDWEWVRARAVIAMVLLMYSPSVYNQSCSWTAAAQYHAYVNKTANISGHHSQQQQADWASAGSSLSGYDLFRCAVVLAVTCGLISGNFILALAVNCKYSAGILQFQVGFSLLLSDTSLV